MSQDGVTEKNERLSVIIPYAQEWPMSVFTIRSVMEELEGRVDYEILAVDNWCPELEEQIKKSGAKRDRTGEHLDALQKGYPWLRSLHYEEKLSHWQSKNYAVAHSTGKFLWFCDAHVAVRRDSLFNMYNYYKEHYEELNGTLHLPLSYHIMESHRLIYKLVTALERGEVHYSFTGYRVAEEPYRVPCMSTCGMMMTRDLFIELGGWPVQLGIYGGGENFINFTLAVLGKTVNIFPGKQLCHHGDKRGYHWNGDDYVRNRTIANYIFGGVDLARRFIDNRKGSKRVLYNILNDVLDTCETHRNLIEEKQVISIEDWIAQQSR